jgi:uncharacterized protein YpmB
MRKSRFLIKIFALAVVMVVSGVGSGFFQKELERKTADAAAEHFAGRISLREKQAVIEAAGVPLLVVKTATALIAGCLIIFIVIEFIRFVRVWKQIRKYSEDL